MKLKQRKIEFRAFSYMISVHFRRRLNSKSADNKRLLEMKCVCRVDNVAIESITP